MISDTISFVDFESNTQKLKAMEMEIRNESVCEIIIHTMLAEKHYPLNRSRITWKKKTKNKIHPHAVVFIVWSLEKSFHICRFDSTIDPVVCSDFESCSGFREIHSICAQMRNKIRGNQFQFHRTVMHSSERKKNVVPTMCQSLKKKCI